MAYGDKIKFRDSRGRFRKARTFEKNEFYQVNTLSKGIANFEFKTGDGVIEAAEKFAGKLLAYAQDNAPWEDDTGDARRGLFCEGYADNDEVTILLCHTVYYGIYLEVRNGAKFAIIMPTIEALGPGIYKDMQGMCGEIIYYVD
jgi:hypothetical protein